MIMIWGIILENKFTDQLSQLQSGKIDKIEVTHSEFMDFLSVWNLRSDCKFFRGQAQHGRHTTYVYDTTVV